MPKPSKFDIVNFKKSRVFIENCRETFLNSFVSADGNILEIGDQGKYADSIKLFKITTLDIDPDSQSDICADITKTNDFIPSASFEAIICSEVLEHVVDPFAAVRELKRILKKGGVALFTTPLNARIHGPIPDCWRFTEFGLNILMKDFEIIWFNKLETISRNLFPLHYGIIVKNSYSDRDELDPRTLKFKKID